MRNKSGLQNPQIICDRRTAYLTRPGEPRRLEDATALRKDEFSELLKGIPPFQTKELLNVLGPVGVDPFLKVSFFKIFRQEERRQSSAHEPVVQVYLFCIREVSQAHRRKPQVVLAPREG